MWKTQRKTFSEKFEKIKHQQQIIQKELEKKRRSILTRFEKDQEHHSETKNFIVEEMNKKKEMQTLKKIDQQENLMLNQRQKELLKQKLIEKHLIMKQQLEVFK